MLFRTISISLYTLFFYVLLLENQVEGELEKLILLFTIDWGNEMIYTALTNKALRLAYAAHHGQTDKSGQPYIFHPYHLAEQMTDEVGVCAALLHDVVEDTAVTLEELEREFPKEVIDVLRLLTDVYKRQVLH